MIDFINNLDHAAMVALNFPEYHNTSVDFFFWMTSQILVWTPVILFFLYVLFKNKGKEAFLIAGLVILVFVACDQISSGFLKPLFARPRPSHDPLIEDSLRYVFDYHGGAFGFPSSHAANSFGFAVFSALLLKNRLYTFSAILWAILCAYSRIYLGVHFPGDIFFGTLLGIGLGFLFHFIYKKLHERYFKYNNSSSRINSVKYTHSGFAKKDIHLIVIVLYTIIFSVICCSLQLQ